MPPRASTPATILALTLACGGSADGPDASTGISTFSPDDGNDEASEGVWNTVTTVAPTSTDGTNGTDSATDAETTTEVDPTDDATTEPFTTGSDNELGTDGAPGCAKLDVLFVISNSATMDNQQPQLTSAIPAFLETIQSELAGFDLHVMVVSDDDTWGIPDCKLQCAENDDQGCEPIGPQDYPCDAYAPGVLEPCDAKRGAGQTFPAGLNAANERCFTHDRRFLKGDDDDFAGAFTCVADLGYTDGGASRAMTSMTRAVSPALADTCNAGFLRDDAMLLVTTIDDEGSNSWDDGADVWAAALLEAKHGDADALVYLAVTTDGWEKVSICNPNGGWGGKVPVIELAEGLEHGLWGSVCADDYAPFFADAAALVLEVCESFEPM